MQIEGIAGILLVQDDQVDRDDVVAPVGEGLQGFGQQGRFAIADAHQQNWVIARDAESPTSRTALSRFAPGYAARRAMPPPGKARRSKSAGYFRGRKRSAPVRVVPFRCGRGPLQKRRWIAMPGLVMRQLFQRFSAGGCRQRQECDPGFRMRFQVNFLRQ